MEYNSNQMAGEAREKCGVVGIVGNDELFPASEAAAEALIAMQHRGAEATGVAVQSSDTEIAYHRGNGLVPHVLRPNDLRSLVGSTAIGHNRYSTNGSKTEHHQPVVDEDLGLAFAHNGNLPDTSRTERFLETRHIRTKRLNDSEMMSRVIGEFIREGMDLPDAIQESTNYFDGAYSCVAMHDGVVAAFRDPKGIRPLSIGQSEDGWYAVASETCGLDIVDTEFVRDVIPGEMVVLSPGKLESRRFAEDEPRLDIFEFVYFSRHDSMLGGERVNEVRRRFGRQLAIEHPPEFDHGETVVVPVPDTSIPAAEGYAEALGLPHRQSVIKNRYVGRTFMQPTDLERKLHLRRKHNIIPEDITGKDVIFIDDSIVRLNTMPILVELARQSKPRSISVLIASPPVRFPDFYGIDTPKQSELAAANMGRHKMTRKIGCSYLGFLSLEGMVQATGLPAERFNLSCFNGDYPIDIGKRKKEVGNPIEWGVHLVGAAK